MFPTLLGGREFCVWIGLDMLAALLGGGLRIVRVYVRPQLLARYRAVTGAHNIQHPFSGRPRPLADSLLADAELSRQRRWPADDLQGAFKVFFHVANGKVQLFQCQVILSATRESKTLQ